MERLLSFPCPFMWLRVEYHTYKKGVIMEAELNLIKDSEEQIYNPKEAKKRGRDFEKYLVDFLNNLNFKPVFGADDAFNINGQKIDVIAGFGEHLFIIECKTSQALGRTNKEAKLKGYIDKFRGRFRAIREATSKDKRFSDYKYKHFIIAIKDFPLTAEIKRYVKEEGDRLYCWDKNFFDYYLDFYSKVGDYAKYSLLGEMRCSPINAEVIEVLAIRSISEQGYEIYSFMTCPRNLLDSCYVARRGLGHERYYQRILDGEKIKKIAEFLNDKEGRPVLANNIIIAFDDHLNKEIKFEPVTFKKKNILNLCSIGVEIGVLKFPKSYQSCWIIDGQHRLYAFKDVEKIINVPVVAFKNLPIAQQGKIFLDINKNQKPVPPDLVWDLNGELQADTSSEGIISKTVKSLNQKSVLVNRIFIPSLGFKKKPEDLKLAGLCESLYRKKFGERILLRKVENPYFSNDPAKFIHNLSKGLIDYFEVISNLFDFNWSLGRKGFILTDGGISVFINLLEKILDHLRRRPAKEDFEEYLLPIMELILEKYSNDERLKDLREKIANEAGKSSILKEFVFRIRRSGN